MQHEGHGWGFLVDFGLVSEHESPGIFRLERNHNVSYILGEQTNKSHSVQKIVEESQQKPQFVGSCFWPKADCAENKIGGAPRNTARPEHGDCH